MRRPGAVLLAAGLAAVLAYAPAAPSQDAPGGQTHYWPHRTFYIPLVVATIEQADPKPTHLQLYSAVNRGKWQAGQKLPLNGLQSIGGGKKGFAYTADRDGEFEFSVQYHYADGASSPKAGDELNPMLSVVIDTTPPDVRVVPNANGVEWTARDDNIDPQKVRLECKFPQWTEWKAITGTRAFRTSDAYAWKLQPGQVLDVRVIAHDRAGNEGVSVPVRVPADAAVGTTFPKNGGGSDWPPRNVGSGASVPTPRIQYVDGKDLQIDYTIQRAGRSGVQAAHLYVSKDQGPWELVKKYPIQPPAETGKTLNLKYAADKEGIYGFYVAPESGAGVAADPPRANEPPMMHVVADWTKPYVKITGVRATPGGKSGPLVEIQWETQDQNLLADPISLEYSVDKNAAEWKPIKHRLKPGVERPDAQGLTRYVGQFPWEINDEHLWKFYVRIKSVDKAGNTELFVWPDEVIVDLEKPAAGITGVRGGNTPNPGGNTSNPSGSDAPLSPPPKTPAPTVPKTTPAPKMPAPTKDDGRPAVPPTPPLPPATLPE